MAQIHGIIEVFAVTLMNRESIIAIGLGLLLGIVVAVGTVSITVSRQKERNTKVQTQPQQASSAATIKPLVPTVTVLQSLEIEAPVSGKITDAKSITVSGTAGEDTLIILQSAIATKATRTSAANFSAEVPLAMGENVITVSAYHDGTTVPVQKKLYIYRLSL